MVLDDGVTVMDIDDKLWRVLYLEDEIQKLEQEVSNITKKIIELDRERNRLRNEIADLVKNDYVRSISK